MGSEKWNDMENWSRNRRYSGALQVWVPKRFKHCCQHFTRPTKMIWIAGMLNGNTNGSVNEEEAGKNHSKRWNTNCYSSCSTSSSIRFRKCKAICLAWDKHRHGIGSSVWHRSWSGHWDMKNNCQPVKIGIMSSVAAFPGLEFIIDGTERTIRRPKDKKRQESHYKRKGVNSRTFCFSGGGEKSGPTLGLEKTL